MSIYRSIVRPVLFRLPPETVHELGLKALRRWRESGGNDRSSSFAESLTTQVLGLSFSNPLGVAAGFDKNGLVVNQLASLGFGFVEVGTVTFEPQPGNPKPRLFRLPADGALINRLGFNNDGAKAMAERLRVFDRRCILGVNIGRNKDVANENAVENYVRTFDLVSPYADYVAVNVSSPNTPNLRDLQRHDHLEELLSALLSRSQERPLLLKIAPDLSHSELEAIVDTCVRLGIAGLIATNTTTSRRHLKTTRVDEYGPGGLSGRPLQSRSNEIISLIYRHSAGKLPIIGVGGIFTAADAFSKIAAGASLVQAYTGFVYQGPSFAREICIRLSEMLQERGFSNVAEAVGSDVN